MTSRTEQALTVQQQKTAELGGYLQKLTPHMRGVLPRHLNPERILRIALTQIRKDPKLADCIPESFAGSLLTAAAIGLEPGVNGEAYLVPYKGECTLIVGYQGLAKLFYQHPLAKHLDAQTVYEHDEFDYGYGTDPFLTHKPTKGERGKVVAFYACASLSTGAKAFVVLTPDEVKALRGSSRQSQIADPMHWMSRKTALRQLFKLLPKSPALQRALAADEQPGSEAYQQLAAEKEAAAALPAANDEQPPVTTGDGQQVNPATGEVIDAELVDPDERTDWPETAQVPT